MRALLKFKVRADAERLGTSVKPFDVPKVIVKASAVVALPTFATTYAAPSLASSAKFSAPETNCPPRTKVSTSTASVKVIVIVSLLSKLPSLLVLSTTNGKLAASPGAVTSTVTATLTFVF